MSAARHPLHYRAVRLHATAAAVMNAIITHLSRGAGGHVGYHGDEGCLQPAPTVRRHGHPADADAALT